MRALHNRNNIDDIRYLFSIVQWSHFMIKAFILTIFLLNTILSDDDFFLSRFEYGKALYDNPRGISCKRCHGIQGVGKIIIKYKSKKKKEITIKTSNMKKLSYERFLKALNTKGKSIMPKYFLSDDEIFSLYYYIQGKE